MGPARILDRLNVFSAIEKYATSVVKAVKSGLKPPGLNLQTFFGGNEDKDAFSGKGCVLRAVCEVAHVRHQWIFYMPLA